MSEVKMTQLQFKQVAKTWINNKLILSQKSNWYKIPYRKMSIVKIQDAFNGFLFNTANYSIVQLALLLKRNEALLENVLPIPSNPSYENSRHLLETLLNEAETIINTYNLTV